MSLQNGDVFKTTKVTVSWPASDKKVRGKIPMNSITYGPPKGHVFIALLLGVEPSDGSRPLDPEQTLRSWGWKFEEPKAESEPKS